MVTTSSGEKDAPAFEMPIDNKTNATGRWKSIEILREVRLLPDPVNGPRKSFDIYQNVKMSVD